ncbi:phage/plasmid primase, P4 family [Lysinibacillus sp. NPDC056232]|uniref:DNA primase family protein n=1 Tax=Lysinibacillus sp. NPDC056232 TaxID=3345756 RepID=UPI0035D594DA
MKKKKLQFTKTNLQVGLDILNQKHPLVYEELNFPVNQQNEFFIDERFKKLDSHLSSAPTVNKEIPYSRKKEKSHAISNNDLAAIVMQNNTFITLEDALYHWDDEKGYYIGVTTEYADKFIRQNIPDHYKSKINTNSIREIVQWIKSDKNIVAPEDLFDKKSNLVSFANGVFDTERDLFLAHDPSYFFTSVINANYRDGQIKGGYYFEKFMSDITNNNRSLYLRIQELFGYVISEVRNVKYIPYLLGPKDTGKSIILKTLEHLVGKESFTNLSFEQLNKPEYLAQLLGKRLNTCGETSEFRLNKLDVFKKLSGGDYITARPIYGQPINFINSAVLLFAGNHLPTINGVDKSNAFSQRIIIFPFNNPISKSQQDTQLFEKLLDEKDYIVKWALEGLKRWKLNNYVFTNCAEIKDVTDAYYEQNNSIDSFIQTHCKIHPSYQIYTNDFENAYNQYCFEIGVIPETKQIIHKYLKTLSNLSYRRFRDGKGNNKYGYRGIELKEINHI